MCPCVIHVYVWTRARDYSQKVWVLICKIRNCLHYFLFFPQEKGTVLKLEKNMHLDLKGPI